MYFLNGKLIKIGFFNNQIVPTLINYNRLEGGINMYYYGCSGGYGYPYQQGCGCGGGNNYGGGYGYGAAIILVLFILLVIVIGARAFN